jgi:ABC-type nitrate/sulfonate/bicarbonate transport system substrate-binding protein
MQRSHRFHGVFRTWRLLAVAAAVLAMACAPAAPSPTAAPAKPAEVKPTEAPKPAATAAPAAAPAAVPAASPAAAPAAAAKPAEKAISLPKPEVTSIKIGNSALEPTQFTFKFAEDLGLYQKYGIEKTESFYFDGAGKALQALVAGQVDINVNTGGPVLSSLTTDSPLVMVGMYVNKVSDNLVSVGDIKNPADLKGKNVAISQFGGESHAVVVLSLKGLGLTPNDVTIQQIGGQSARIAALKAGSVSAAPVDAVLEQEMTQQGFNVLIRLPDTPLELARSGLVVPRDWVRKNPNTVLALVAASLEAQQRMFTETEKAIDSYASWTQTTERPKAESAVKDFLKLARRDLRWNKEGWETVRDVGATENPALTDVDVTQAYTVEFLDKLRDMGFNDVVGVPKS